MLPKFKLIHYDAHYYLAIDKSLPALERSGAMAEKTPAIPTTLFSGQISPNSSGPPLNVFLKALDGVLSQLKLKDLSRFAAPSDLAVMKGCKSDLMAAYKKAHSSRGPRGKGVFTDAFDTFIESNKNEIMGHVKRYLGNCTHTTRTGRRLRYTHNGESMSEAEFKKLCAENEPHITRQ